MLGTQPAGDVTVTVGGTAGDVTVDSATLTFTAANYDTAQTVTVSAAEDNDGDADPPVKLTHAASGGGYGGVTVGAVTVTVTENDTKAVTVAPAELTVAEGGSGSYTVVLGTQPAGDVTVTVGGTAGDVTVDSATLTFTAANYDTAQTVTVSAAEDNDGDADPPVKLTHAASGGGYGGVTVGAVTVTVTENDTKAVTVAPAELTVAEGGSGSYTVVLGTQPAGDVTVTVGGTAGDVTVDSATLTFTAANYDTAQTVTVSAAEDNDGDADPPVKLTHAASGGGYGGVTVGAVTVTVTENDTKAVTVAPAELTVAEGGSGSYTVVLGTQPAGDVTVTVGGTAGDVTVDSATLTFTAANYDTAQTVTVSAAEDNDGDADPPVKLTHAASGGGYGGVTVGAVTVTVTENDTKAVTVAPAELTVAEGGSGSYTVVLGTQPAGDVTVTVGGTAGDVTVDSATLTFTAANYDTAQTVTVSAAEDNDGDADPPVKLTHAASGGGYGGVTVGAVTVTVTENDTKAVTVAPAELTVAEGGSGSYTVVLGTQPAGDVTVTVGGTAGDVTVDSATLTFTAANYDTAQTVTVSAAEDNDGDADPPVKLTHAASGGGYGGVTVGAVTVTVTENDTKAVTVAPAELTVAEGGSGSYTVVLGTQPAGDVTVTVGGTAGDVTVDSATLTFTAANYDTAQTVTVSAAEDNDGDADPPVKLTHAASGGGYGGVTVGAVTVTVTENDTKAVTVAPAELTVAEGGSGSYTVVLGTQPAGDVTVTVGGTAGDVTVDSATLTFTAANYDTAQTVTVSAAEDNDGDADPPVKLTHAAGYGGVTVGAVSGGGYGGVTVGAVTVTVTENDTKAVTVAPAELTVAEGGSGSYTVVLGTQPAGDVTVTVGGTAGDVTVDSATLTFTAANYDTAQTVTVSAAEDNDGDADPPVKLTHAASGGGYGGVTVGAVTVTVTENDTKAVTVAPAELTVAEGGSGSYTVVLGTQPAGDVTVTVGGTAGDVTVDSATLTFTAANYDTAQTVTVSAAEDNDGDADPPVKLTHAASGGGYGGVTVGAVTVTVTENDTKAVTVAPAELTVAEGGSGSYTVVLGTQPAGDVTVTVGGTAGDVTVDSATLTFTAANYDTAQTVTVSAAEDNDGDADPPVKLTHAASGGGYGGVTVGAVTVTVTENDTKAVTVAPAELTVAEGGSGSYTVVLGTQPAGDVTVTVGGTAGDVTVDSATLTFTAANYDTAQTVTVSAAEDNDGDADPPVKLTHAASGGGYGGVTVGAVTVTVTENDTKAVTVAPAELTVAEGGSGSYTVVLGTQPAGDVTVTVGGTAGDVTVDSATLTFTAANYDTAQTVTVSAAEDNDGDADPPVKLTHAASGGGYGGVTVGAVTVTVTENDTKAVTVAPAELTVAEGGSGSYTVVLGTQPAGDVTVTVGGTAGDVTVDSATLTFTAANYDTAQTVTVSAAEDNDGDADPPVKLTHAASGGGYGGVTVGAVTVTVTENDTKAVTVAPAELTVAEGGSGSYTVVLGTQPAGDVTVTVGGTAGDVTVDSATLTFTAANYDTAQTVTVSAAEDNDGDADPPVKLTHAASGGGYGGVTVGAVTVTVTENDTKAVTVAPAELTVAEGGSGSYTVVLGTQPAGDVTVTVGGTAGDVTVDSATLTFTAANYDTAQTVTVSAAEDNDGDADPPVKLTHAASGGGYGGVTVGAVTVTVTENDTKAVTVAPAELTVAEGGSGSYTVVLGTQPAGDVTVTVGGTAGDVTVDSATLTFTAANYDTAQTVTVSAAEDNDGDADPPVKLTHAASGGGYGGVTVGAVTVTVTENDTKAVTVAPAELTVAEGGSGSYTVVLGTQPAGDVTVTVGGTAGDVTVDSATLTFTAANYDTAQTVTVSAAEDNDGDADPPVKLTHAASGGGYGGVTVGAVTVTVTENDTKAVTVAPAELTVAEGGSGSYTVVLGTQPAGDVTVTVGGTAGDVTVDSATLTFTAANYDTAQTVTVSAAEDNDGDADPPVKLTHAASGGGYGGVTVGAVTVTVTENDTKAVTVAPAELTVAEGGSGSYTVVLGTQPAGDVTVTVGGTAGDVTVDSATLTFTAANYDTAQTVTVSAAEDNDGDADPPVKLTHAASGGGYGGVTVGAVTVTVTETTPVLQLLNNPETVVEGTSINLKVASNQPLTGTRTVKLTLTDRSSSGFTARDISGSLGPRNFNVVFGDTANVVGTVTIPTVLDSVVEGEETYRITLKEATGYVVGNDVTADGALTDSTNTVSVPTMLSVTEGLDDHAVVTVTVSSAFDQAVTLNVTYRTGTATGHETPQSGDYDNDAVTSITFGGSETVKDITIPITDDDLNENNETFTVTIGLIGGNTLPIGFTFGNVTTTVTIKDNDSEEDSIPEQESAGGMVSMPMALTVSEGSDEFAMIRPTLSVAFGQEVTLNVAYGGTATGFGSLRSGVDYDNDMTTSLAFGSSDMSMDIMIPIMDDRLDEPDETITVAIAADSNLPTNFAFGNAMTMVTIVDDDHSPVLANIADLTISAGEEVDITALATDADGDTVTYTWARSPTEATPVLPDGTALNVAQLNFTPPRTGIYTMTVTASDGINTDTEDVVITVQQTLGVTLSKLKMTLTEGASDSYTVVLDSQPSADVVITVDVPSGDVSVSSNRLTFTTSNWNLAQTVTVSAANDADALQDSDVTLTHSAVGGGYGRVQIDSIVVRIIETTEPDDLRRANRINSEILPYLIDAMGSTDAIRERVEAAVAGESASTLQFGVFPTPGALEWQDDQWTNAKQSQPEFQELLNGAAFTLPIEKFGSDKDVATAWGRSEWLNLAGSGKDITWDGGLWSANFGADFRFGSSILAGAAVSWFDGDFDAYADNLKTDYETELVLLQPYTAWLSDDGSNLWSSIGYGEGKVWIMEEGNKPRRATELTIANATVGGRNMLITDPDMIAGGLTRIAIRGEGSLTWGETAAGDGLQALTVNSRRVRLLMQGSHERELLSSAHLKSTLEIGMRYDEGDVAAGSSLETGVRLSYHRLPSRLTLELHARGLFPDDSDRKEWGVGGRVQLDPATDGSGLFFTLTPNYGNTTTNFAQLFDYTLNSPTELESGMKPNLHLDAELGYGFSVPGHESQAVLSPYAGLSWADGGNQTVRLGVRYDHTHALSMSLEAERRTIPTSSAEHGIMLRGVLNW